MEQELQKQEMDMKNKLILKREKHIIYIDNPKFPEKKLRYDLVNQRMEQLGKRKEWLPTSRQYAFFYSLSIPDIFCKEEHFKDLIQKTSQLNPRCTSLSTFFTRLHQALVYENYIQEGIKTQCSCDWGYQRILTKPLEFYNRKVIAFFKKYKIEVTCDVERCFIEDCKFMNLIMEEIDQDYLDHVDKKDLFDSLVHNSYIRESIRDLMKKYNYDLTALIKYVYNYLKPFENLDFRTSIEQLKDYF